jgi:hypothetical protein
MQISISHLFLEGSQLNSSSLENPLQMKTGQNNKYDTTKTRFEQK